MDPFSFLKQKLSQGLSDVEQWGSDAGNAVTGALHDVFNNNNQSSQSQQSQPQQTQQVQTPSSPTSIGTLPINNPMATQNQQQNPVLKLNFGQNQPVQQQAPTPQSPQLNTSLVNFNKPTSIKTQPLQGSFNATPHPTAQNSGPIDNFLGTLGENTLVPIGRQVKSLAGGVVGLGKAAQGVQSFDPTEVKQGLSQARPIATVARQAAQSIPQEGVRLAKTVFNPQTNTTPVISKNPVTSFLVGKQPVESYQQIAHTTPGGTASKAGGVVAQGLGDVLNAVGLAKGAIKVGGLLKGGDPDIVKAANNVTKIAKTNLPQSEEESLNSTAGRATATKEVDTLPSPYNLRKGIGVAPEDITEADRREASYTQSTPEYIAGRRIVNERNVEAEQAAQQVLEGGGTRQDAVRAYQDAHPGITKKDALFRVSRMAKESKLALRPNERSINPEEGQHDLPRATPGDYEQAPINKARIEGTTDALLKRANDALTNLSQADRDDFEDYLEGTKDITKADRPQDVQKAIDASTKLTDTGNEFDHQVGGQTPHIDKYFPGYIKRDEEPSEADQLAAEQQAEEVAGPKAWQNMSEDERRQAAAEMLVESKGNTNLRDDENFGGFRNQKRQFANRAERRAAKIEDEYTDPRDSLTRYANGLKYKIANDAFAKAAQEADVENIKNGIGGTVRYSTAKSARVDLSKEGAEALKDSDITSGRRGILTKINTGIKKVLIATGVPHVVIIPPRFLGARLALETPDLKGLLDGSTDITKEDIGNPIQSDNIEFGHQIDSPLHGDRFGSGVSRTTRNPFARVVYNYLLPKMHDSLLSAAKDYMDARGIDYNSPKAREIGHQINDVMGYSRNGTGIFDQSTFAPSLIKSTANMYRRSVLPNGTVARGGALGQQLSNQALGFISKAISNQISVNQGKPQNKSQDDFWSTVQKEALSPSLYTPFRKGASKGNAGEQIDLGIPGQYQSDLLKIALNTQRGNNGKLKVGLNNPSQALTNLTQTGKDIASPVLSLALSGITNQTYSGKQVRNPYASPLTQLEQTGVNAGAGALPINIQTPVNEALSKILPPKFQNDIPQNATGGTALRVASQTLGLNPKADTTTGQGPATQRYYEGQTKGQQFIAANTTNMATQNADMAVYNKYFSRSKTDSGQTIQLNQADSQANWGDIASNPTALKAVQIAEQNNGKGNYDPEWDLNPQQLQEYARYKSLAPGDPEKDVLAQQNPFITQTEQASIAWANQQTFSGNTVNGPGYIPYPTIPDNVNNMMTQATQLANIPEVQRTPNQINQLNQLENDPGVQQAYQQIQQYTNASRAQMGLSQINYSPNIPPAVTNFTNAYTAASTADRKTMRTQNPSMYAQMQQAYENTDLANVEKQGAIAYLGGQPKDSLLSSAYGLGVYDINKTANPNGTSSYSLTNFSPSLPLNTSGLPTENAVNGYAPGSFSQSSYAKGGGGSSKSPLVPMPKIKRVKKVKMKRAPKLRGFRAPHVKKAGRVHVSANGQVKPTQVAKPVSVVKLAH